jgi:hypothetical protein
MAMIFFIIDLLSRVSRAARLSACGFIVGRRFSLHIISSSFLPDSKTSLLKVSDAISAQHLDCHELKI